MERANTVAGHRTVALLLEELETHQMFAVDLSLDAPHEIGHAVGLAHDADTAAKSIMKAYYTASYDKAKLATDVARSLRSERLVRQQN